MVKNVRLWFLGLIVVSAFGIYGCKKEKPDVEIPVRLGDCTGSDKRDTVYSEIPNLDFENWFVGQGGKFLDPLPCNFWATPNQGSVFAIGQINAPVAVFRVGKDSAYSGNYAAMLKTGVSNLGVLGKKITAGSIASARFKVDLSDILKSMDFGRTFYKRPKTVSGYYKYYPVQGDSASVYCFVTKGKGNTLDTLGLGRKIFYNEQNSYAKFEFDLEYKSTDTPEEIVIYFSSSEAGDEFLGREGNTLFIDEVKVTYHD